MFTVIDQENEFRIKFDQTFDQRMYKGRLGIFLTVTCTISKILDDGVEMILNKESSTCVPVDKFNMDRGRKTSLSRVLKIFTKKFRGLVWSEYFEEYPKEVDILHLITNQGFILESRHPRYVFIKYIIVDGKKIPLDNTYINFTCDGSDEVYDIQVEWENKFNKFNIRQKFIALVKILRENGYLKQGFNIKEDLSFNGF